MKRHETGRLLEKGKWQDMPVVLQQLCLSFVGDCKEIGAWQRVCNAWHLPNSRVEQVWKKAYEQRWTTRLLPSAGDVANWTRQYKTRAEGGRNWRAGIWSTKSPTTERICFPRVLPCHVICGAIFFDHYLGCLPTGNLIMVDLKTGVAANRKIDFIGTALAVDEPSETVCVGGNCGQIVVLRGRQLEQFVGEIGREWLRFLGLPSQKAIYHVETNGKWVAASQQSRQQICLWNLEQPSPTPCRILTVSPGNIAFMSCRPTGAFAVDWQNSCLYVVAQNGVLQRCQLDLTSSLKDHEEAEQFVPVGSWPDGGSSNDPPYIPFLFHRRLGTATTKSGFLIGSSANRVGGQATFKIPVDGDPAIHESTTVLDVNCTAINSEVMVIQGSQGNLGIVDLVSMRMTSCGRVLPRVWGIAVSETSLAWGAYGSGPDEDRTTIRQDLIVHRFF